MPKYISLNEKYLPSEPCSCDVCTNFCKRPGWWTVDEASAAIDAGYANRMMLEISPEYKFSVLSPAFKGAESNYALSIFSGNFCTFLENGLCTLHSSRFQPLECRFCHHDRMGEGKKCHKDIENDWNTEKGQALVQKWIILTNFTKKIEFYKKFGFPKK